MANGIRDQFKKNLDMEMKSLLTGQVKPQYEGFINTKMDLINRNMTLSETFNIKT